MYPSPQWALKAGASGVKKKKGLLDKDNSDDISASDMEEDEDELSTQPLAKLLKSADILSRTTKDTGKHQQLRAGRIDIQHLARIGKRRNISLIYSDLDHTNTNRA